MPKFMSCRLHLLAQISVAYIVVLSLSSEAFAQASKPTDVLEKTAISIQIQNLPPQEAVALLSRRLGRAVLSDGVPHRKRVSVTSVGTVKQVLDAFADALDCNWSLSKGGVVLLRKRFRDADELPQLDPAELKHSADLILESLNAFPYDPNPAHHTPLINQFYRSLGAKQIEALSSGATLYARDLAPAQSRLLQQAVLNASLARFREQWHGFGVTIDQLIGSKPFYVQTRILTAKLLRSEDTAPPGPATTVKFKTFEFVLSDRFGKSVPIPLLTQSLDKE